MFQITASPSARSRQLWRRTGNFFKTFLQFYVYDLRFKAAGLTTILIEFWTLPLPLFGFIPWSFWLVRFQGMWRWNSFFHLSLSSWSMWMWLAHWYSLTKILQSCLIMRQWAYMSGRLGFILAPVCLALLSGLLFGLIPGLLTNYMHLPLISKNEKKMTSPN